MALKSGKKPIEAPTIKRPRETKFQADLAPSEDRTMRALKDELQLTSNSDLLSDALALFRWAVAERKLGHRIIRERVAPDVVLPRVEVEWTERELESLADLASRREANRRTAALIRAMRG